MLIQALAMFGGLALKPDLALAYLAQTGLGLSGLVPDPNPDDPFNLIINWVELCLTYPNCNSPNRAK